MIATNVMLSTEQFPRANDEWEDLDPSERTWMRWKTVYKVAAKKAKVKKQAAEGQDRFGRAHAATDGLGTSETGLLAIGGNHRPHAPAPFTMEVLEGCFDNLAAAATTKRAVMEELVKANGTLTTTNEDLVGVVKKLTAENKQLQQEVNSLCKKAGGDKGPRQQGLGRQPVTCPNCKKPAWHKPDDCFELEQNATRRSVGWKSSM